MTDSNEKPTSDGSSLAKRYASMTEEEKEAARQAQQDRYKLFYGKKKVDDEL